MLTFLTFPIYVSQATTTTSKKKKNYLHGEKWADLKTKKYVLNTN